MKKTFHYYTLVQIILLLAFFDGIRSNLLIGPYLTIAKAVITFSTFIFVFVAYHRHIRLERSIKILCAYLAFIFLISCVEALDANVWWGVRFFAQYFLIVLFIYVFQPLVYSGQFTRSRVLTAIVRIGVFFVLSTWFLYFVELPIWAHFHPWWGRISQGYPTGEVFMISVPLAIAMFYKNLEFTPPHYALKRLICSILLTAGLVGEMSGTGFVMLALVYGVFIGRSLYGKNIRHIVRYIVLLSLFVFIFKVVSDVIRTEYPMLYEQMEYTGGNRLDILLGRKSDVDINTLEVRSEQYERQRKKLIGDVTEYLFGVGAVYATSDADIIHPKKIYIESQYSLNQITLGLLGNVLMVACFASLLIRTMRRRDIGADVKITYSLFVALFATACANVCPFNCYSTIVLFALCYVLINDNLYIKKRINRNP